MIPNNLCSTVRRQTAKLMAAALLVLCATAIAAPFDKWIEFTQPDGTLVRIHGQGDEFYARFQTDEGYTVVFDVAQKAYCFATLDASGDLVSTGVQIGAGRTAPAGVPSGLRIGPEKKSEKIQQRYAKWESQMQIGPRWQQLKQTARQHYTPRDPNGPQLAPPPFPTVGLKVGLTMLVDFPDADTHAVSEAEIVNYLNGDNYAGYGNNGSVKQYFLDNSAGLLTYTNIVTVYVRAPNPKSFYNDVTKDAGMQGNQLIKDCLDVLKTLPSFQTDIVPLLEALTVDTQNRAVAFNVFYVGDNGGVWSMGLWPHSSALWMVGEQELTTGGKKVWRYQITNIGDRLSLGTFCHENGHMLCGYPDLYDYGYDSVGGAGNFSLMGYGGAELNPVQIDAYLKRASGWATVTEVTSASSLTGMSSSSGVGFNHFYRYQKPGLSTEYYLIENRQQSGRDASAPGSGLAIWHVDELGDKDIQSMVYNTAHFNYELTLVQADGRWDFQNNRNPGDASDLWYEGNPAPGYPIDFSDDSMPSSKWWDGTRSGFLVTEISPTGTDMTFHIGLETAARVGLVTVLGGNGNGIIDPNECNQLFIELYNDSDMPLTGISARLASSTPGVIISQRESLYPNLSPQSTNLNLTAFQISTAPGFVCGTPIDFTLIVTTDLGTGANQFQVQTGLVGPATEFPNLLRMFIPDGSPEGANSTVTVSNVAGAVQKVTVSVHIAHSWVGDVKIQLISPTGITNTLSAYHGSGGRNYGLNCGARTIFDDDALTPVSSVGSPFVGSFIPDEPLSMFKGLLGDGVNGTWTLHVEDGSPFDFGFLECWSLNLSMAECADGMGECPGADLGVSMSAAPDPVIIGQSLTYSIKVTNAGPSTAKSVILSQVLPPGVVVNSIIPSQGSASQAGGVVTCNLGGIGALGRATLQVRVTPTIAGIASSSATVSSEQPDYNLANNSVSMQTQVNPPTADLSVRLNAIPSTVVLGETVILTMTIVNNGPSAASPVFVTNTLPAGLALSSSSSSQGTILTPSAKVVVCSLGALASGNAATATLNLVAIGEGQSHVTARAVANQFDPISANNSASVAIAVGPATDLALGIMDSPDPVLTNSVFTWMAVITNRGPSEASGVVLTLDVPDNVTVLATNTTRGTLAIQEGVLYCDIGTMSKGSIETVSIQMLAASPGTVSAFGSVAGNEADLVAPNNTAMVATTISLPVVSVVPAGATLIAETIPNGAIDSGETNTVVLRLRNVGNITTTNLIARLLDTGGIIPVGGTEQHYGVLAPSGWPVGKAFTFAANGSNGATVTATLELRDGPVTSTASFTFKLPTTYRFANTNAITIPALGNAQTYPSTIAVSGVSGMVSEVKATIDGFTHTFPKDVSMLVSAPAGSSCLIMSHAGRPNPLPVSLAFCDSAASVIGTTTQLATGTWRPSSYAPAPLFPDPAPAVHANSMAVFNGNNPNGIWSLFAMDDSAGDHGGIAQGWVLDITTIAPVNQSADLSITGVAAPSTALAGSEVTYTFAVTNAGPDTANAVSVTNSIPANSTLVSAGSSQGSSSVLLSSVLTDLGSIPAGGIATVQLLVVPGADAIGSLPCSAAVTANETDLNLVKNAVTVAAAINPPVADMAITQTSPSITIVQGQDVQIDLVVVNNGPGPALATVVMNSIPMGLSIVSATTTRGSATVDGSLVLCHFGDIEAGGQAGAQIIVRALSVGLLNNVAVVATRSADSDPLNNSASLEFTSMAPVPQINLASKRVVNESMLPPNGTIEDGESVSLLIGLSNTGTAAADNLTATLVPITGIAMGGSSTQDYGTLPIASAVVYRPFAITASGAPGSIISARLDVRSGTNLNTLVSFPVEFMLPGSAVFANNSLIRIPETGASMPYPSQITITNGIGYVKSAKVTLHDFAHSFPSDLTIVAVAPNGKSTVLMSGAGGPYAVNGANLVFDDAADAGLPANAQLASGTWKPTAFGPVGSLPPPAPSAPYGPALASFVGSPVNGTWSLYVLDSITGDGGAISNGWSLEIQSLDVVNSVADLSIDLSSSPAQLVVGGWCTNRIVVMNAGPGAAEYVLVTNLLPAGATDVHAFAEAGTTEGSDKLVWNAGTLSSGGMAVCSVVFRLANQGEFPSIANVASWATEFELSNNSKQISLVVTMAPTIEATVSNGVCQLLISGRAGATCVTEYSAELINWTNLATSTIPASGVLKQTDPEPALGARFYRVRLE